MKQSAPAVTTNTKYKCWIKRRLGCLSVTVSTALSTKCKVGHSSEIQMEPVKTFGFFTCKGCLKNIHMFEGVESTMRVYTPFGKLCNCGYGSVLLWFLEHAEINTNSGEINEKHICIVLCPFNGCLFLWLSDSLTTDNMWVCPAVLTNDLLPSFKRPTETLQEAECVMGPRTDRVLRFILY